MVSNKEKVYLQDLAKQYKAICDSEKNLIKKQRWIEINDLKTDAVPVFMNHYWPLALNEIFPLDEYECESVEAREFEIYLKTKLFYAIELDDDNVCEPVIYSKLDCSIEDYKGFGRKIKRSGDDLDESGAYEMVAVLNDEEDIKKISLPEIHYNEEKSYEYYKEACEIFEPTLTVLKKPFTMAAKIADEFSWLRGMENTYMDMYDKPEWMHEALGKIRDNFKARFHKLEDLGVWGTLDHSEPLGSAGLRYATGLPDFRDVDDPFKHKVKLSDSWGFTCAEVFNCVSNAMHDEFSFEYDKDVMNLFKYINVGCCEVLDKKVDLCKALDNTLKVSISEWCDHKEAAIAIKDDYVYSYRAAGIHFVNDEWDAKSAEAEIRSVLEASKENDCKTEIVLNIGGTLGKSPREKVIAWSKMVRNLVNEYYPQAAVL